MGPRSADRGNDGMSGERFLRLSASMGPRSADRGNAEDREQRAIAILASMGPRSADRGNGPWALVWARTFELQWGRDQLIAEMPVEAAGSTPPGALQWGRDQLIAEMVLVAPMPAYSLTLQWGRDQLIAEIRPSGSCRGVRSSLQWGRDQLIAEMQSCRSIPPSIKPASMGPRSADRGNSPASILFRFQRPTGASASGSEKNPLLRPISQSFHNLTY